MTSGSDGTVRHGTTRWNIPRLLKLYYERGIESLDLRTRSEGNSCERWTKSKIYIYKEEIAKSRLVLAVPCGFACEEFN